MTRLSGHRFRSNQVRLRLRVMAYNLGIIGGGRLVKHARHSWLLLAESHLTRRLFGTMVRRTAALSAPVG
jgi:hypothetical protein